MTFWSWVNDLLIDFYLPVILPPPKLLPLPPNYYDQFEQMGVKLTASSPAPGQPIDITIENPTLRQEDHEGHPKVATVFASLSGFVTYVGGEVILRIWGGDFDRLEKPATGARPNVIVLGALDPASVETAIKPVVTALATPILEESWKQDHTGTPPDRAALEAAYLQRFASGSASVFVRAGTPLGEGSVVPASTTQVHFTLKTFFAPPAPALPVPVPPEDFIDNAGTLIRRTKYQGHPLVKALDSVISVAFQSQFFIWNNAMFAYEALKNTKVTLLARPWPAVANDFIEPLELGDATTDTAGLISMVAPPLPARTMISFRYATTGKPYGNRVYPSDVETNAHMARLHVDPDFVNRRQYKAKYEIYPLYQDFIDDIADRDDAEIKEKDRGNASKKYDHSGLSFGAIGESIVPQIFEDVAVPFKQRDLLLEIESFEAAYKADVLFPKSQTFNVLVEGDSWLNYPVAFNDIWGQLDRIFWSRLKPGIAYNRIPLQHMGDRGDQMFRVGPDAQWHYTEQFLDEYPIDLIICSAGGNDFAEPGISNETPLEEFKTRFTDGHFDPDKAGSLSVDDVAVAKRLVNQSFAILLNNHRWNCLWGTTTPHLQMDEAAMTAALETHLTAIGKDFGPDPDEVKAILHSLAQFYPELASIINSVTGSSVGDAVASLLETIGFGYGAINSVIDALILQPIGEKVIANFPDDPEPASPEQALLDFVLDQTKFNDRYDQVTGYWKVLLDAASKRGIPVVGHTYGYPLFDENPASLLGWGKEGLAGPWFINRFREARIIDRRVEKICLKALIDRFVRQLLIPFKTTLYPGIFDFVDVRNLNSSCDLWRDEMHMRAEGYRKLAERIYDVVHANPKLSGFFRF
jgi:hypothetical protein